MSLLKNIILSLWLMAAASGAFAYQEAVQAKSLVSPSKTTLGGEIRLVIQVSSPDAYTVESPSEKNKLQPFEIKKVETSPPAFKNGYRVDTFTLTLTVFELGDLVVPPLAVLYKDGSGRAGQVMTGPMKVKVSGVKKLPTDKDDIRPIKGPVSINLKHWRDVLWAVLALLLTAGLIVKVILRRRGQKIKDLESSKPPHERAGLELGRLQNSGWLQEGKIKEYYSELADILRRYLERRFCFQTMDLTTLELLRELKSRNFSSEVIVRAGNVLENSDLVKFAKLVPARSLAGELVVHIDRIVELTKPEEPQVKKK